MKQAHVSPSWSNERLDAFSPAQVSGIIGRGLIAGKKYRFWWSAQGPIAFA
jgi:hypothetical protein